MGKLSIKKLVKKIKKLNKIKLFAIIKKKEEK